MIKATLFLLGLSFCANGLITSTGPTLSCLNKFVGITSSKVLIVNNNWNIDRETNVDFESYIKLQTQADIIQCGVKSIALVGSSVGVCVAQMAIAKEPSYYNGGYIIISGAGGAHWDFEEFVQNVNTPVFQLVGSLENPLLIHKMAALNDSLLFAGKETYMKIYEGCSHGFLGENIAAQEDIKQCLQWTLFNGKTPSWWPVKEKVE